MRKALFIIIAFAVLFVLQNSCFADPGETVVDQVGRRVQLPNQPVRIVSLAPSITEIIYDLGRESRLVGATQYSNFPEAARDLPRVGSYVKLDLEKIVALQPDLCIGTKDGNPLHTVEKIVSLGIPVYITDPQDLQGIMDVVMRLGRLLDAVGRAEELVADMRGRIERITAGVAKTKNRPLVFFQIDAAPIISAGDHTFINELITLAGGRNAAAGPLMYPRYSWEDILRLQPEMVLVASMAGGHSPGDLKAGWQKWEQIPAVRDNRIHVVNANLIDRPTPRLVKGLEEFAGIIHPELFGENRGQ